jgi:hypothetical protein
VRSKALLVIMALSASLAIGLFAAGCGGGGDEVDSPAESTPAASKGVTPNPPKSNPDNGVFREIAARACIGSAEEEGVAAETAEKYCNCAIDELLKNVDANELKQIGAAGLSGDVALPPDVEKKMMDAVLYCIDIGNLAAY